ncbi:YbjN domain-containing protein [Solimonas sp. K1W22B-7]|uniref:YbjN domain-containing protein n=1 Tax=Solimonas sp. K1W22B-7 TaxID=2303331 RepID=UPI000E32FB0D|nr:YbjN domain-containing protein [Solimonas sp. K1W22B-7]AXQ30354.1 YbjN domain-containing protein [Solimonas sp. K1W22B-7]
MNPLISSLTLEEAAETLRASGLRAQLAEQDGRPMLQSAVQGLGFILMPGNRAPDQADRYIDFTFSCLIHVEGQVSPAQVGRWNESKRFARLYTTQQTLVLAMDVFIGAGDAPLCLRGYCELWDRVLHEFITYLRTLPVHAPAAVPAVA